MVWNLEGQRGYVSSQAKAVRSKAYEKASLIGLRLSDKQPIVWHGGSGGDCWRRDRGVRYRQTAGG